jgi:hemerythrin-like domain-containing protein
MTSQAWTLPAADAAAADTAKTLEAVGPMEPPPKEPLAESEADSPAAKTADEALSDTEPVLATGNTPAVESTTLRPLDPLRRDHEVILSALALLEGIIDRVERRVAPLEPVAEEVPRLLRLISAFADGGHHFREETIFFEALKTLGLNADEPPLSVLGRDHEEGKFWLDLLEQIVVEPGWTDSVRVIKPARAYVALLRRHILREENVIFPWAERALAVEEGEVVRGRLEELAHRPLDQHAQSQLVEEVARLGPRYLAPVPVRHR